MDLALPDIHKGEVWLRVVNGHLYRVTEEPRQQTGGWYGTAERIRPPQAGCDIGYMSAIWPDSIRKGQWIRVLNPSSDDLGTGEGNEHDKQVP